MVAASKNGHLFFSEEEGATPSGLSKNIKIDVGQSERPPACWSFEALVAIYEIYNIAKGNLVVEMGLRPTGHILVTLLKTTLQLNLRAAICRLPSDQNLAEVSCAIQFCISAGVAFDIYDLPVRDPVRLASPHFAQPRAPQAVAGGISIIRRAPIRAVRAATFRTSR